MKAGTDRKPKFLMLKRELGLPSYAVVGLLQSIWTLTGTQAERGDLGRFTDEEIALTLDWPGDPAGLIAALIKTRWLDPHPVHRLLVHDWPDHAEDWVRKRVERAGRGWAAEDGAAGPASAEFIEREHEHDHEQEREREQDHEQEQEHEQERERDGGRRCPPLAAVGRSRGRMPSPLPVPMPLPKRSSARRRAAGAGTAAPPAGRARKNIEVDGDLPDNPPAPNGASGPGAGPAAPRAASLDADFRRFWAQYPRRDCGEPKARRAFAHAASRPDWPGLEIALAALAWFRGTDQWREPRYIPSPVTWLREARWTGVPEAAAPEAGSPDGGGPRDARGGEEARRGPSFRDRIAACVARDDSFAARWAAWVAGRDPAERSPETADNFSVGYFFSQNSDWVIDLEEEERAGRAEDPGRSGALRV